MRHITARLAMVIASTLLAWSLPASAEPEPVAEAPEASPPPVGVREDSRSDEDVLVDEVLRLRAEVEALRRALAGAELSAAAARRDLAEIQQFLSDHRTYGTDFQQYQAVRKAAEQQQRQQAIDAAREARDEERAERRARYLAAREERDVQLAEQRRETQYRDSGFTPIGLDMFVGRMAFHYGTRENANARISYEPGIGRYLRFHGAYEEINFNLMTISGSVLSAADDIRNVGVAVTFFDENGNQVGHEIVQVKNARPDVPYPFTSTIEMALNRPFESSSVYVLYADPVPAPTE